MNNVVRTTVRELERKYKDMPDECILQEVTTGHHAGEALFYLLFGRHAEMLKFIYSQQSLTLMDFDDFMLELDIRLFKDDCQAILSYQPQKASFKTYLSTIAHNLLYDLREKELPTLDVFALRDTLYYSSEGEEVMWLMEAINNYPNKDSRYVLLKTIEGYKSKEIATMLTSRRHEEGTLAQDEELKPSYINTLRSRALKEIRKQRYGIEKLYDIKERKFCKDLYNIVECEPSRSEISGIDDDVLFSIPVVSQKLFEKKLSFKAGLFIDNIKNLYNQMMEE